MECKLCGTVNTDDAIFCKQCGVRLDGKKSCTFCNAENDLDAKFCNKCGAEFNATVSSATVKNHSNEKALHESKPFNWKRFLEIVSCISAMSGLFLAILFTCFIGLSVRTDSGEVSVSYLLGNNTVTNIFYFFSGAYKNLKSITPSLGNTDQVVAYFIPVVMGTIISAGIIITVLTLAIISIVRLVKYAQGRDCRDFAPTTIVAILVYIIGSLTLLGMYHVSQEVTTDLSIVTTSVVLNLPTVAGIILCGICLCIFVVSRVALKGKDIAANNQIVRIILGSISIVLLCVLVSFLPRGAIAVSQKISDGSEQYSLSFFELLKVIILSSPSEPVVEWVISAAAQFVQFCLMVMVVITLFNQLLNLYGKQGSNTLDISIPTLVLAITYFVLTIILEAKVKNTLEIENSHCINTIIVLVISVLYFVVCVVQTILKRKQVLSNQIQTVE